MKRITSPIQKPFLQSLIICCFLMVSFSVLTENKKAENEDPDTNYFSQRNAYYGLVPADVKAQIKAQLMKDMTLQKTQPIGGSTPSWQFIGPSNTGGRVVDIVMPKGSDSIIYVAAASGGVFKSYDFGQTWVSIFDSQGFLSIGALAIDPTNDNILYVGTGEPNTGGGSITYDGNGIYKSTDAGNTWTSVGLTDAGTIGRISISKTNPNLIYVAAVGNIFQKSTGKGLYKSVDGGANWTKVLYVSDSTSINDVAISPADDNTVYACAWERISRPQGRVYGGITTNLYKSTNGGSTWVKLLADDANAGKLTIGIPPTNANILYMSEANKDGTYRNIYKYDGSTFTAVGNGLNGGTAYVWWFGGIKCHPTNDQIVYYSDFTLYRTTNGGSKWSSVASSSHVDQHAVFIHPVDTNIVLIGNDGGIYTSTNQLSKITSCQVPNTQIYDFDVYKGDETFTSAAFQDNSFANTSNQVANTWKPFGGGDGVEVRVDPTDKTQTYSSQYLGLSITTSGISGSDRVNWRCPIRLDPVNPKVRYIGTNKVYKFSPTSNKWTALSGDLTNGAVAGNPNFGTITAIAVAPTNNQYIYSGADDGSVYVTKNGGTTWTRITSGLPAFWTTFITVNRTNPEIVYIGFSGYRYGVQGANIYKSTNAGASWTQISNNLPQMPVNDMVIDSARSRLYLATDIGVYYSTNDGTTWTTLGTGMPPVVTTTLYYAPISKYLYAATYGRSVYKINLSGNLGVTIHLGGSTSVVTRNAGTSNESQVFKIYPNPAKSFIHVVLPSDLKNARINIYNSAGVQVISEKIADNASQKSIQLSELTSGSYILECIGDGEKYTDNFIVQK